jgi:hypothetical protein
MPGGYVIQVGKEKPAEAIISHADKKTGNPVGEQMTTFIRVGAHLIMNTAVVWGRRIIRGMDGKVKEHQSDIEYHTPGYKGEIEFLLWGADGGYAITIRYLPQSRSLDLEYQNNVLRIIVKDDQWTHIRLDAGQNKFDLKKDEVKVAFLRVCPANMNSISKNPDPEIKGYQFYEITDEHVDKTSIKMIDRSVEASSLVKNYSNKPTELRNLFKSMGKREEFGNTDELSSDGQIYKALYEFAYQYPEAFFYLLEYYKQAIEDDFGKAKSYGALDLTKDGHIAIEINNKKILVFSNVQAKGEAMTDWVKENFVEEEVFKAIQIFKTHVSKLK